LAAEIGLQAVDAPCPDMRNPSYRTFNLFEGAAEVIGPKNQDKDYGIPLGPSVS